MVSQTFDTTVVFSILYGCELQMVREHDEMEIIIFWEMTPCGSYKNRRFGGSLRVVAYTRAYNFALCLLALVHPEDGGDTILRNVGSYKSHTASSPRRL
jgi:hypothetical protein